MKLEIIFNVESEEEAMEIVRCMPYGDTDRFVFTIKKDHEEFLTIP